MRFYVDIGNTRIKAAAFEADELKPWPTLLTQAPDFEAWSALGSAAVDAVLVSNVGGRAVGEAVSGALKNLTGCEAMTVKVLNPLAAFTTAYDNPAKLGVDRWLAALAGWMQHRQAVCVVDAGTAMTVDVVSNSGEHLGGMIAPGMALMQQALTKGTANLESDKLVHVAEFATNTNDAIALGCESAARGLLHITQARLKRVLNSDDCHWVFTGGGAAALCEHVDWPHAIDNELVLKGIGLVDQYQ